MKSISNDPSREGRCTVLHDRGSRVNDSKTSPSEDVLKKLGLQRIVFYVRGI